MHNSCRNVYFVFFLTKSLKDPEFYSLVLKTMNKQHSYSKLQYFSAQIIKKPIMETQKATRETKPNQP